MIVLIQKFLGYNHLILALVRKGLYLCHINVTVDVDALRLLCKNNRNMKMTCYDTGDADAGSLEGDHGMHTILLNFFYREEEEQKYEVCIRDFQNSLLFRRLRYNEIKRLGRYAGFSVPFGFCGYII